MRILKYRIMGMGASAFGVKPFLPAVAKMMFGASTLKNNQDLVNEYREIFAGIGTESIVNSLPSLTGRGSVVSRLADSELVVIPEAGHLSAIEQPERVNVAIREFLKRL